MSPLAWVALGLVAGSAAGVLASRWQVRRSMARARTAERRARTAERLAELGAMTGGLAHEIKNPLSTIGLNAQLLSEGIDELPTDQPVRPEERLRLTRRLTALRRETERLRGILSDFLNYAGELRLDVQRTDVNRLVDELADFFSPQATQQGVRLRLDLGEGPLEAMLDAGVTKQAILNIWLNAVQAMAGTTGPKELIVSTRRRPEPDGGGVIELRVIDTGPGIAPDVLPKIFTPYFTTKAGGSGLGLPTTRRLVEAQHGRLDVHSELGKGTSFALAFPLAGEHPPDAGGRMVDRDDPDRHPRAG